MSVGKTVWRHKRRKYLHFDPSVSSQFAEKYVSDSCRIEKHGFWPFIRFVSETKRYKSTAGKTLTKRRALFYASHIDSSVYSFYSHQLNELYETRLKDDGLAGNVLAYRRGLGPAYQHAIDVFEWAEKHRPCDLYAFDVKGFFDSLDHRRLKQTWKGLVGSMHGLPRDHYNVWKSLTRYAYVDKGQVDEFLKCGGLVGSSRARICSPLEFRREFRPHVKTHQGSLGIPQGSPISAVLSNIYMLEFDRWAAAFARKHQGLYRRYADDILLAFPKYQAPNAATLTEIVAHELTGIALHLQEEKSSHCEIPAIGQIDKPFDYLGLCYDGADIRIRSRTISRFYRKMKMGVRSKRHAAERRDSDLWTASLWEQYSHVGSRNFYSYVDRVSEASGCDVPKKQLRRHTDILKCEIDKARKELRRRRRRKLK